MTPHRVGNRAIWQIRAQQPIAYDVIEQPGLFDTTGQHEPLPGLAPGGRRFVVMDTRVAHLHGEKIRAWFAQHHIEIHVARLPAEETGKTMAACESLLRQLDDFPIHRRREPLIAIGGGVVTDVAGFVAACHRRGVPHVKIPTTLMGLVDAALGIKAGVNFNGHKNRVGGFEPPLAVILDTTFLRTLPRRHLLNGLCEIIKLAIVCDLALFERLEAHAIQAVNTAFADAAGQALLRHAVGGMLNELAPDLHETNLYRKVDFGHTFSYGLEMTHPQRLLHGEAVLMDCLVSCLIAQARGLLPADEVARVFALAQALGIALAWDLLDADLLWRSLCERVLHRDGRQRIPVPHGLGQCVFLDDLTQPELQAAVGALASYLEIPHEPLLER